MKVSWTPSLLYQHYLEHITFKGTMAEKMTAQSTCLNCLILEVTHITSAHILVAETNHFALI